MTKIHRITLPYNNINYLMLNWAKVYKVCSYVHVLQMVKIRQRIYKQTTYLLPPPPPPPKKKKKKKKKKNYLFIAKTKYFFECVPVITSVFPCFGVFWYFYKPKIFERMEMRTFPKHPLSFSEDCRM